MENNSTPGVEASMVTANASDVKHKLYMRMVMRMTEKFGGDQRSLRVIKECLDLKLNNR